MGIFVKTMKLCFDYALLFSNQLLSVVCLTK